MKNETMHRPNTGKLAARCLAVAAVVFLARSWAGAAAPDSQTRGGAQPASPVVGTALEAPLDLVQIAQNSVYWPKEITLVKSVSLPVVFAGRVAGQTTVPAGSRLRLIRVVAAQVEIESLGMRHLIAADSTDLLAAATRIRASAPAAPAVPAARAFSTFPAAMGTGGSTVSYGTRAREVTEEIQRDFWNPQTGLYAEKPGAKNPDVIWSGGVMFSALVAAARNEPVLYRPVLKKFFDGLDTYWDRKQPLGGYEPLPTNGNGNDKYYDDNEWLVISFLEARAVTGDSVYARRAAETMKFVLSGWDETYLKGGIWWHEAHEKKTPQKNTCANGPAAVACLQLAKISPPEEARRLIAMARKIADWTAATLQAENGLFIDSRNIEGEGFNHAQLTYNSALMVRAFLGLHQVSGNLVYLRKAQRIGVAADAMLDKKTGIYRDPEKWAHLMVEADLALYRTTREPYLLERARRQADTYYDRWKEKGPVDLITVASIARVLWLMADLETEAGRSFWRKEDACRPGFAPVSFQ